MDAFEAYFKRADLDQDGRISGPEAVAFFQGSNLPQQVLAQIWMHADQNRSGFLARLEFYNALKLVTVAQSGRELSPEIVKAALFGPAASKIPAPRMNPAPSSTPQMTPSVATRPPTPLGATLPTSIRGATAVIPGLGVNQQFVSPSNSNLVRPPSSTPSLPLQGVNQGLPGSAIVSNPSLTLNASTSWSGTNNGYSEPGVAPKLITSFGSTNSSTIPLDAKDSNASIVSVNGSSSGGSNFGGDAFSVTGGAKQDGPSTFSSSSVLHSSGSSSVTAASQNLVKSSVLDSLQSTSVHPGGVNQLHDTVRSSSAPTVASLPSGTQNSAIQSQIPWPKISQSNIQKYTKVFVEVDKDRDGKITGEQARNLFLSWRLPREVLKQVWDLADQDSDSMLSLREFCIALYLMERYREGRPLPSALPDVLRFDETLLHATGQPAISPVGPIWRPNPGLSQQEISRPSMPVTGMRPPVQSSVPYLVHGALQFSHQGTMPPFQGNQVDQLNKEQTIEEASDGDKKAEEMENKILDSREKIEYYRSKMQELVLYRSRCDNKLNEITERASADKHEVESLTKKYEEKYKQVAEVASKLAVEDAIFRDLQGRKLELQNAIIHMEKGGSSDGLLQVRADRIQSDLEGLVKALLERCKHHGLHVKSNSTVELPFGWQSGIQDGAQDWDEDWDKFEDEGFSFAKDLSAQVGSNVAPSKVKTIAWDDKASASVASPPASPLPPYSMDEKFSDEVGRITKSHRESVYAQSEYGSVRSPPGSPGTSIFGASSQVFHPTNLEMHDISPRGEDSHSDRGGAESTFSGDKFTDDPSWGAAFDASDDVDSVWGFSAKSTGHERSSQSSFGAGDFGLDPIRVDSPSSANALGLDKKSPFFDSVPSTPQYKSNFSPRFSEGPEEQSLSSFGRFDSFNMHDSRFSPKPENLTRFDSIRSTSDFGQNRGYSFDDSDPFSAGPFKSSEARSPRKDSDHWSSF
ncbi:hypothetical protein AXF42_Ash014530 [Apostasia shenzhenica]|uniref:Uncharacterized protein n=1 Tax=Apostasia shenzhenica TaxID=1088818 RepID=A0A2H9ZWW0_9ASPA|nr:hypothetical protein AXF42_Ash014530 [Apostasia shenzhenica]